MMMMMMMMMMTCTLSVSKNKESNRRCWKRIRENDMVNIENFGDS
jgi:hypothetical protein